MIPRLLLLIALLVVAPPPSVSAARTATASKRAPAPKAKHGTNAKARKTAPAGKTAHEAKGAKPAPADTTARLAEGPRRLEDIHIEGEIPAPQVLFVTARDQRRFTRFHHQRYLKTSVQVGETTWLPTRVALTNHPPTSAGAP
jgi:hypothetical protein